MNTTATSNLIQNGGEESNELLDVPLVNFKKLKVQELKCFIHVRLFDSGSVPKGESSAIPSKKEKIDDALNGENNLLKATCDSRALPIKLSHPVMNDDGTVKLVEEVDDIGDGDEDIDVDDIIDIRDNDVIDVVDEDASDGSSNPPRLIVDCTQEPNTVTPPH